MYTYYCILIDMDIDHLFRDAVVQMEQRERRAHCVHARGDGCLRVLH